MTLFHKTKQANKSQDLHPELGSKEDKACDPDEYNGNND